MFGQLWADQDCRIFHNYSLKGTIFEKQSILHEICSLIFSSALVFIVVMGRIREVFFMNTLRFHARCLIFVPILTKFVFYRSTVMKVTNLKFYESLSREAYVFHAEGRRDMKKLIVAFRSFGNAYKKATHQRSSTPPTPPTLLPRISMPVEEERKRDGCATALSITHCRSILLFTTLAERRGLASPGLQRQLSRLHWFGWLAIINILFKILRTISQCFPVDLTLAIKEKLHVTLSLRVKLQE